MAANPFNLAQRAKRAESAESDNAFEVELEREDVREIAKTLTGRRFLQRLLADLGLQRSTFSTDAFVMAKRAGRQEFAVSLLELIEDAAPQAAAEMHAERIERRHAKKESHDRRN